MSAELEPWVVRLNAECDELYNRIQRLLLFLQGDKLSPIDVGQGALLAIQIHAMMTYHCVLVFRLSMVGIKKDVVK